MSKLKFFQLPQPLAARRDLPPGAKVLYAVIADRIGANGVCWPGLRRLAADCGMDVQAVRANVARLETAGFLMIEQRNSGQSNRYRVKPQSVVKITTPPKGKCGDNHPPGVVKTPTEARGKSPQNQTDPLNQTQKKRHAAGKPPPDPRIKTFIDWFFQVYKVATGNRYIVQGGKDGATVKRLLRQLGNGDGHDPMPELQAAATAMLADPWGRERASIGLLASQINTWRQKDRGAAPASAADRAINATAEKTHAAR